MHVCLGWGSAESRHAPPTAASRLRGGGLSVRVPQVPCRLHAVCVQCLRGESTTPVTRQLRLRFLRRSDESQTSALKTRDKASISPAGLHERFEGVGGPLWGALSSNWSWHISFRAEPGLWQLAQTMLPGAKQLSPTSSCELAGLARPDLATLALLSVLNTLFCSQHTTPSVGVLSDTPHWGSQLCTTCQSRRAQASLPQQPRPRHLSEWPHEVEAAPRQLGAGESREATLVGWRIVLRPPSLELCGGRALTTQAGSCTVNKLHVSLLQVQQAWDSGRLSGSGGWLLLPLVCSNPECLGHQSEVVAQRTFSICLKSQHFRNQNGHLCSSLCTCSPSDRGALKPGVLSQGVCCWAFLRDPPQSS